MIFSKCSPILVLAYFHLLCTPGKVNVGYFTFNIFILHFVTQHSIPLPGGHGMHLNGEPCFFPQAWVYQKDSHELCLGMYMDVNGNLGDFVLHNYLNDGCSAICMQEYLALLYWTRPLAQGHMQPVVKYLPICQCWNCPSLTKPGRKWQECRAAV